MAALDRDEVLILRETVKGSLFKILEFAGYSEDNAREAKDTISAYMAETDDDKKRALRKSLNNMFFVTYKECVYEAMEADEVPPVVMMFILFGYMDEDLAGMQNAIALCKMAQNYNPTKDSNVKSLFDWLKMIYSGKRMPSVNDMSVDYEADLREQLKCKEITQAEYDSLLKDRNRKFMFELNNAISIMRIVSGTPTRFLAIFEEASLEMPLAKAYISDRTADDELNKIINVDVMLFSHEFTYANKDIGLDNVRILKEIKPDVVMLPIIGSRPMMWQEIEGRNRQTAGRFFFPRFLNGNVRDQLIRCCATYRWEYCKREQGARWQDMSDPSLCSYFCNYIQTYKKNSTISQDQKDKISAQYSKYRHNVREIFIDDYTKYIVNEAEGNIRLNKLSREILIRFCVLNKDIRAELVKNNLYTAYISQVNNKMEHEKKQVATMKKRIAEFEGKIPAELIAHEEIVNR